MTKEELDALALEVVNEYDPSETYFPYRNDVVELLRRYRAALVEKMEPVAYLHRYIYLDGSPVAKVAIGHCPEYNGQQPKSSEPLYSLEDWKK